MLGLHYGRLDGDLAAFRRTLSEAQRVVRSWGATLHLVYLPEMDRFVGLFPSAGAYGLRNARLAMVASELSIGFIDVAASFHSHAEPLSLFNREDQHYNAEGAAVIATQIAQAFQH